MQTARSGPATAKQQTAAHLRQIGFIPLLAVFYGYTAVEFQAVLPYHSGTSH